MPTGYTAAVQDGTITTLPEYALKCARAFGACITMRDDSMDSPIPDAFEPNTKYYDEMIVEAQKTLAELDAISREEMERRAEEAFQEQLVSYNDSFADCTLRRQRYADMLAKVEAWEVPKDIYPLKHFMTQQLEESTRFDCYEPTYPTRLRAAQGWQHEKEKAERDLAYATEHRDGEIARTAERNDWLRQLREALK